MQLHNKHYRYLAIFAVNDNLPPSLLPCYCFNLPLFISIIIR